MIHSWNRNSAILSGSNSAPTIQQVQNHIDALRDAPEYTIVNGAVPQIQMIKKIAEVPSIQPAAFPTVGEVIQEIAEIPVVKQMEVPQIQTIEQIAGSADEENCEDCSECPYDDDEFYVQCDDCYSIGIYEQCCTQCKFFSCPPD